jgi:5'-3' exonuclease
MILLVDADSLIFASCYRKRETLDDDIFYRDIVDARNKFDQQFMKIVNDLEEKYTIDKVLTFSGAKGNFRKLITKKYKANRKKQNLPPLLSEMHEYVIKQYDSIIGYGVETDDMVARYWYQISQDIGRNEVMIV